MVLVGILLALYLTVYKKTRLAGVALLLYFVFDQVLQYPNIGFPMLTAIAVMRILSIGVSFVLLGGYMKNV